ncbi:MAG: CNNM domain-containing protein [Planctomycetota bacterium]
MLAVYIVTALLLIVINAFFVLAEFAIVKVRQTRVEELAQAGNIRAKILKNIQESIDEYLSVCQLGITLASIGLGFVGEHAFATIFTYLLKFINIHSSIVIHTVAIIASYIFVSYLHILFGELIPKSIAIRQSEKASLLSSYPLRVFRGLFYIPLQILNFNVKVLLRLLRCSTNIKESFHSEEEIRMILERSENIGVMSFPRLLLMENILDFGTRKVKDAMKKRHEVKTLNINSPWEENLAIIKEYKYSRYPLIDNVQPLPVGIIHVKNILFNINNIKQSSDLVAFAKPYQIINEDTALETLVLTLQKNRTHVAITTDNQGRWTGFITFEDILEEIVGSIEDEFEKEPPLIVSDIINKKHIILQLEADNLTQAIEECILSISLHDISISVDSIMEAVLDRVKKMKVYVVEGLVILPARLSGLSAPLLILARSPRGITIEGGIERIYFMIIILTPLDIPHLYTRLLAKILNLVGSEYVRNHLIRAKTKDQIVEILKSADPISLS